MADTNNKVVKYELRGDNTNLIKSIQGVLNKLDALDKKLNQVAAREGTTTRKGTQPSKAAFSNLVAITNALDKLNKVRQTLVETDIDIISPTQKKLIQAAKLELNELIQRIGTIKQFKLFSEKDQQSILENTTKKITQLEKGLHQAGIAAAKLKTSEKDLNNEIKEQEKALRAANKAQQEANKTYAQAVSKVKNIIRTLSVFIRRIFNLGLDLMEFSSDFAETMNKFNVVAGEASEELGNFAQQMSNVLGLDIQDMYEAVATFKSIANSIHLSNKESIDFSKTLTAIAVDLASVQNTSVDKAINALTSGLHGALKPLKQYNIYLYEANLSAVALRIGLDRNVKTLNEAEKVMLRYISILEQGSYAQGDMARTLSSAGNQLRIAKAQFASLKRGIGQLVTVIGLTVVPVLNALFSGLSRMFAGIARSLGYEIEDFTSIFGESTDTVNDATSALEDYETAAKGLSSLDEINLIDQKSKGNLLDTSGNLVIDKKILEAINKLDAYDNKMSQIGNTIGATADMIAKGFENTLIIDALKLLVKGLKAVASGIQWVADHWEIMQVPIKTIINLLTILLAITVVNKLKEWGKSITLVVNKLKALKDISIQMPVIFKNAQDMINPLTGKINGLTLAFSALTFAASYALFTTIFDQFEGSTKRLIGLFGTLISILTIATVAWMSYNTAMSWGAAMPIITGAIGLGAASIKAMIPQMATGGVVSEPTVAMIGEGKYDEAVVPLGNSPQFRSMKEGIAEEVARSLAQSPMFDQRSRGNVNTPIILQVNGREFARAILPNIGYAQPQTGVKLTR